MASHTAKDVDPEDDDGLATGARVSAWLDQVRFYVYSGLLILLLIMGVLWKRILITVQPGNHAVLFNRFSGGTQIEPVYGEGMHVIWPWNALIVYETRLQQRTLTFHVLSEEGLQLGVTLTIRYTPVVANLGYLHRDIGPSYFERLIQPDIEGHLRHTFGGRPAHQLYSSAREVLQEISRVPLLGRAVQPAGPGTNPVTDSYLRLEEIKLVGVELPPVLVNAINEKQKQEQLTMEYKYRLQREEKEAERKRTEAAGIRDFSLIAGKVSPDVLRWRAIDAAADLAKSNNAKVILLGNSPSSSPIMLNVSDTPAPPAATSEPTQPTKAKQPDKK